MWPAVWMVAGSVVSGVAVSAYVGRDLTREVLLGMFAPLVVAVISWVLVERAFRRSRQQVTNVMVVAFGVKMVFFGAYVAVMLRGLALRPVPFVVSFTAYFIGLHVAEAWCLGRLFGEDPPSAR